MCQDTFVLLFVQTDRLSLQHLWTWTPQSARNTMMGRNKTFHVHLKCKLYSQIFIIKTIHTSAMLHSLSTGRSYSCKHSPHPILYLPTDSGCVCFCLLFWHTVMSYVVCSDVLVINTKLNRTLYGTYSKSETHIYASVRNMWPMNSRQIQTKNESVYPNPHMSSSSVPQSCTAVHKPL